MGLFITLMDGLVNLRQVVEYFSYSVPIFSLATFNANNGKIMITTDDDIDFYNFGLFIQRTHKEA